MSLLKSVPQFYFETHLTFDPTNAECTYEEFANMAKEMGWKASKFEHDDVDDIVGMWFMSNRCDKTDMLKHEILGMIHGLSANGLECIRWKVEQTCADSKLGHKLEDL